MKKTLLSIIAIAGAMLLGSCSKEGEQTSELTLSKTEVTVHIGTPEKIDITSGNGSYAVSTSDAAIATAVIEGNAVIITGVKEGPAIVQVSDGKGKTASVTVTVSGAVVDLTLEAKELNVALGSSKTVKILTGNGNYTVETDKAATATATVEGDVVTINGVAVGTAKITVKDALAKTADIAVTVVEPLKGVDMGVGFGGAYYETSVAMQVPIIHQFIDDQDWANMRAVTMEALVMFRDFATYGKWEDSSTGNWLNTVLGMPGKLQIRLNMAGGDSGVDRRFEGLAGGTSVWSPVIESGKWYHIALTYKNGEMKLYLDGEQVGNDMTDPQGFVDFSTCGDGIPKYRSVADEWDGIINCMYDFFIGSQNLGRWNNGYMSEVRLWGVARTKEQIKKYRTGINPSSVEEAYGLLGYWKMCGATKAEVLQDYSGNGYNAKIVNGEIFPNDENMEFVQYGVIVNY